MPVSAVDLCPFGTVSCDWVTVSGNDLVTSGVEAHRGHTILTFLKIPVLPCPILGFEIGGPISVTGLV